MYLQARETMYVHKMCTERIIARMTPNEKRRLARMSDTSKEAAGIRLRAARRAAGLSQEELGSALEKSKQAINNSENGLSYPSRDALIYLYEEHRIDLNFTVYGAFSQLPGDLQERLFAELFEIESKSGEVRD